MKQLIVLFGCVFLAVGGCQETGRNKNGVEVFIEGGSRKAVFPEIMVGTWEAYAGNDNKWGIKFEADGSIKKITHALAGPVDITAGGVDMDIEKAHFIYVMGPCEAMYIPETNMIKVRIIVDSFIISTPTGETDLKMEDYFNGPVSEDGKTWIAYWREYCWPKDDKPPDPNGDYVRLTFSKVKDVQVMKEDSTQ